MLENLLSEAGATVILCANAGDGMGASLAAAVSASGNVDGWVIALADMPFIQPATIRAVAAALADGASIAAPVLADGRRGHPVGFAAGWRDQLCALEGDSGARRLLADNAERLEAIRTADAGCVIDVDLPADLLLPG